MSRGITGSGVYLPRARIDRTAIQEALGWLAQGKGRGVGQRSYAHWDEDSLTMAVDAARDCIGPSGSASPTAIWFASTTLPFADRNNAGLLAAALGIAPDCRTVDSTGSMRAGTSALLAALESGVESLVVASDARAARPASSQELAYGHGAAAIAVGNAAPFAEYLGGDSSAVDFVDHYKESGADFDYALEERWVREEGHLKLIPPLVAKVLAQAGVDAAALTHFIAPIAEASAKRVAAACGIRADALRPSRFDQCGDIGSGHALLMLTDALSTAAAGDLLLVTGFGEGVDAMLFRVSGEGRAHGNVSNALAAGRREPAYTRYLAHTGVLQIDFGMRAERDARTAHTVAYRRRAEIMGFAGGRCSTCGTVQFPRSRVCVNPACREQDTQAEHRLADVTGQVKSFTEDWLAYSPNPPFVYGNVDIGDGGNIFMEFTDVAVGEVEVGKPVRMVFRLKDVDRVRGFRRYFWKATPVRN